MNKAFSLMEMMVVLIVVAIVAAFGIPNYQKSISQAIAKDAVNNLKTILAAQQLYYLKHDSYYPPGGARVTVNQINTNLHLNLMEQQGVVYSCEGVASAVIIGCYATRSDWTYRIIVTQSTNLPTCTAGACPYTPTI